MNNTLKKALSLMVVASMLSGVINVFNAEYVYALTDKNVKSVEKTSETPVIEIEYETGTQNNAKSRLDDTEATKSENDGSYEVIIPGQNIELDENGEPIITDENPGEIVWEEIHIKTPEDFSEFATNCRLDVWSRNKNVYLDEDIVIAGMENVSVPTFGGHFYGKDHTISGISMHEARSYTGLFDYVQEGACIESLIVKSNVVAEGKQMVTGGIVGENHGEIRNCVFEGKVSGNNYVGGIAGYNELTGNILNCKTLGTISGAYYTGGIAGENVGNISSSINEANVNNVMVDRASSIQDIDLGSYADGIISKLTGTAGEKDNSKSVVDSGFVDTGGIAGLSIGVIQFCQNLGEVGYEHVGYNVGGIAGRQSGYIHGCTNKGVIRGRKDVGGIVGQAEPYVVVDLTEDVIAKLSENIDKLHDVIDTTLSDAGVSSDTITNRLSIVKQFTDKALDETSFLSDKTIDWTNGMVGAGNELMGRAQFIMSETSKDSGPLDKSSNALDETKDAAKDLDKALKDMDIYARMSDYDKQKYDAAKERETYLGETQKKNYDKVKNADKARLIYNNSNDASYGLQSGPLVAYKADGTTIVDVATKIASWNTEPNVTELSEVSIWKHQDGTEHTSNCDKGDGNITSDAEATLVTQAENDSIENAAYYLTAKMYVNNGYSWSDDNLYKAEEDKPNTDASKKKVKKEAEIQAGNILDAASPYIIDASKDASNDARNAANKLSKAAGNMEDAGSQTKSIIRDVASRGGISMPSLGEDYRNSTNALHAALQGMSDNMGALNNEMADSSDVMIDDMSEVNDQFNVIMQLYTDAIDGVLDGDYGDSIEDSSMEVAETCLDATIADCENAGKIEGDLDVAGIAGAMGIEYDFDLESDITKSDDSKFNSTYQSKCVLRKNKNNAHIIAQKSRVGGICGLQEIGTVLGCENYGKVKSNSSDYVGGISGESLSYIQKSVAKCFLVGKNYIGGIAGSGCNILNSYAMVEIDENEADSFYGAIAGDVSEEGKVHYNYFVGDSLAGIDRVSYKGQAEPISYNTFISMDTTPKECSKLYVAFYVDDIETDRIETVYGGSVAKEQFPIYVGDDGTYCKWDKSDISDMKFDVEVNGEYARYITSLASDQMRLNDQSAILVDGRFREGDKLQTILWDVNTLPLEGAVEHWEINIPAGTNERHLIRYKNPDNLDTDVAIYINDAGRWDKVETGMFGAYKTFEVAGAHAELAVVKLKKSYTKIIVISVVSAIAVILLITALIVIIKNKRKTAALEAKKEEEENTDKKADISDSSDETSEDIEIINIDD